MDILKISFNNLDTTALIKKNADQTTETIKYKDLLKEIIKVTVVIEEFSVSKKVIIGIAGKKKNFLLISLTLGILEAGHAFCYMNDEDLRTDANDFNVQYMFSEKFYSSLILLKTFKILGKDIYLYEIDIEKSSNKIDSLRLCYAIKTSGSCGKRKVVHVTYDSIIPNITHMQRIFQLDRNDVILSLSPITFDPFIVDLFLALHAGSSLMFVDDTLRFKPIFFTPTAANESIGVTYMQTTPTLFQQYGYENIQKILSENSTLKYLVLGGEEFPLPYEISKWQNWENEKRKRIFNIYGITEMSCWSTIYEVTNEDLKEDKIPIGNAMDETNCGFQPISDNDYDSYNSSDCIEKLILISNTRICYINNLFSDKRSEGAFAYSTEDLVRRVNGKLYWYGRTNDIIKRFGERVDMNVIERAAKQYTDNSLVSCVYVKKKIVLFYQSSANDEENMKIKLFNHLKLKLDINEIPDDIRHIDFLPLNEHGKVSKLKLRELYREIFEKSKSAMQSVEDIFLEAINQIFNLSIRKPTTVSGDEPDGKRQRCDLNATFNQLGGKSFDALRVMMKIEDKLNMVPNGLLPKLLDDQHTIKDVCEFLKNLKFHENNLTNGHSKISPLKPKSLFKSFKAFDMEKCVDSSPAAFKIDDIDIISIGGHSHKLINLNAKTLEIISQIELGDRIECEVVQFRKKFGIVGCYDGYLYCFDVLSGEILWKFNSSGMIKSKPLVINDGLIIFGNYNQNENLYCIKVDNDGNIDSLWNKHVGDRGIYANILQISSNIVIVVTLSSTIHCIRTDNGEEIWRKNFKFPIFSTPIIIPGRHEFLVAEVSDNIYCIDFDGNIVWNFNDFDGQIFSSFAISNEEDSIKIIFGSHDKFLRCLIYNSQKSKVNLHWKLPLQSQIYSTPKVIRLKDKDYVISCSTNGYINFISLKSGQIEYTKKLPGEIFSSPAITNNFVFIGCRDNNLYGFLL